MAAGNPLEVIAIKDGLVTVSRTGQACFVKTRNPFDIVRQKFNEALSLFGPHEGSGLGFFGVLSYDAVRYLEVLPDSCQKESLVPDIVFFLPGTVLRYDHVSKRLTVTHAHTNEKKAREGLAAIIGRVAGISREGTTSHGFKVSEPKPAIPRHEFAARVKRIIDYIYAGDVFQVNFSQRFASVFTGDTWVLYEKMRQVNPSPFAGLVDLGRLKLLCGSPERLVRVDGGYLETRPIGGTCRRGIDADEDEQLADKLLADPKERAEHIMLVDLERNDLGRSSEPGSVEVNELMVIEKYSHVSHIVSNVCGRLARDLDVFDVLAGMFPGGTITGCPKVRCMEIIDECEDHRRGFYTGSMGYIALDGCADFNIIIRSIVLDGAKASIQVGAGIVADSRPSREFDETIEKAQAMFTALCGSEAEARC